MAEIEKERLKAYGNKIDAEALKIVEDYRFRRSRECGLSHEHVWRMTGFHARFHYKFTELSCPADEKNLAFRCHHRDSFKFLDLSFSYLPFCFLFTETNAWLLRRVSDCILLRDIHGKSCIPLSDVKDQNIPEVLIEFWGLEIICEV